MNNRTAMQTLLLFVGVVVLVGGLVCVGTGFVGIAGPGAQTEGGSSMMLFAAGGFAAVIGFGIVAFTRAGIVARNGGFTRVTIEQGTRGARFCSSCGTPMSATARFCESCGAATGA